MGPQCLPPKSSKQELLLGSGPTRNKSHSTQGLPHLAQRWANNNVLWLRALTTSPWEAGEATHQTPLPTGGCQGSQAGTCPLQLPIKRHKNQPQEQLPSNWVLGGGGGMAASRHTTSQGVQRSRRCEGTSPPPTKPTACTSPPKQLREKEEKKHTNKPHTSC